MQNQHYRPVQSHGDLYRAQLNKLMSHSLDADTAGEGQELARGVDFQRRILRSVFDTSPVLNLFQVAMANGRQFAVPGFTRIGKASYMRQSPADFTNANQLGKVSVTTDGARTALKTFHAFQTVDNQLEDYSSSDDFKMDIGAELAEAVAEGIGEAVISGDQRVSAQNVNGIDGTAGTDVRTAFYGLRAIEGKPAASPIHGNSQAGVTSRNVNAKISDTHIAKSRVALGKHGLNPLALSFHVNPVLMEDIEALDSFTGLGDLQPGYPYVPGMSGTVGSGIGVFASTHIPAAAQPSGRVSGTPAQNTTAQALMVRNDRQFIVLSDEPMSGMNTFMNGMGFAVAMQDEAEFYGKAYVAAAQPTFICTDPSSVQLLRNITLPT